MASESSQAGGFPAPPESIDSSESDVITSLPVHDKTQRREANIYDAVAGRISDEHALMSFNNDGPLSVPSGPPRLNKHSLRTSVLAPEEVLFRRKRAPERYAEHDIYMSHDRDLPHQGRDLLPDSDLLKAIHSYSSRFYSALGGYQRNGHYIGTRNVDEGSMDETALLAFGILAEEAGREVLGKRGDMVFTEGVEAFTDTPPAEQQGRDLLKQESRQPTTVGFEDVGSWKRERKRRKVIDLEEE